MKISLGKSKTYYLKSFEKKDINISGWVRELIEKVEFGKKQTIDVEIISVKDLGFPAGATLEKIYTRAKEKGFELCPAEVGLALPLKLKQEIGDWVIVGMEPITDSHGDLSVFSVGRNGGDQWLLGSRGYPDNFWYPVSRFLFVRSKYQSSALGSLDSALSRAYEAGVDAGKEIAYKEVGVHPDKTPH